LTTPEGSIGCLHDRRRGKKLMGKYRKISDKRNKEFLSAQELALLMGLSRQTIRNWIDKGDIKAYRIGHNLKIPVHEVLRLLRHFGLPVPSWLKDWHSRL
jgi:excisionase family DNA binding protein